MAAHAAAAESRSEVRFLWSLFLWGRWAGRARLSARDKLQDGPARYDLVIG